MGEYLKLMRFYKMKKKFLKIYLIKTGHINCSIMKMRCEVLHFSVDEHSINTDTISGQRALSLPRIFRQMIEYRTEKLRKLGKNIKIK